MKPFLHVVLIGLVLAAKAFSQTTNKPGKISRKWLGGLKGYHEAVELQKQTGADMIVYFADYGPNSQKGLCNWWEQRGMDSGEVKKLLDEFIKVKVELPLNSREEEAFTAYRVNKAPAIFVVRPDSLDFPSRVTVFDWEMKKPKLKEPEEIAELIRSRSSDAARIGDEEETEPSGK